MSYVIVTQRIRNPNAPPSSNVRSRCRSANMEAELCIESCVRGHHVFKRTLTLSVGEELSCKRESDNNKAVAVMRRGTVVGLYNTIFKASFTLVL